jgi:hypothetical protein
MLPRSQGAYQQMPCRARLGRAALVKPGYRLDEPARTCSPQEGLHIDMLPSWTTFFVMVELHVYRRMHARSAHAWPSNQQHMLTMVCVLLF